MDDTARSHLVRDLTKALTMASACSKNHAANGQGYHRWVAGFLTENDRVARAIDTELRELFEGDPELGSLVEATNTRNGRKRLAHHLCESLDAHPHTRAALLSLTQGDPRTDRAAASWRRPSGWFSRKMVLAWMNILIAVPILLTFHSRRSEFDSPTWTVDFARGALLVFIVWVLAFLPSWLYVRFLGLRAGALWNEYVIHLHRLAVDEPRYLPRPPMSSEFYDEWVRDGGHLRDEDHNIYRQKFNAYYGRGVSGAAETDFAVKTETLFPVLLTTVVMSTCWSAVLWDVGFIEGPDTVWDVLKFGFLGAYAFTVQSLVRRFFQSDLRPSAYAAALLRIVVVFTVLAPLHQLIGELGVGVRSAIAFVVGAFPIVGIYALNRTAAVALRTAVPQLTPHYPLNQIDGLNVWYESRLIEEGIEDMQSLVTANLVDVILHTRVPLGRLVDWIDQAQLYFHLDHIEVTRRERRQSQRAETDPTFKDPGWTEQLSGSVGPGIRAGTKTRVLLRQLGIRTATDLLIAFPPAQIDPRTPSDLTGTHYQHLAPTGIDLDQIRMLVRVLDRNTDLAPVWNWQLRGARIRAPHTPDKRRTNGSTPDPRRNCTSPDMIHRDSTPRGPVS